MHTAGKEFGQSSLTTTSNAAKNPVVKEVDFYVANPPQTSGYSSGVNLFAQGTSRINACKTETPGSDKIANQECDAVNFLAKNPYERKKITLPSTDPILVKARDTMSNATTDPATETVCVDKTTTDPDEHSTEICHQVIVAEAKSCTVGRVIEVDTDANFSCDVTYKAIEQAKCRRGSTVSVGFGKCTPNAKLSSTKTNICSYCIDPWIVTEIYCSANGSGYRFNTYTSSNGSSSGLYHTMGAGSLANVAPVTTARRLFGDYGNGCHFPLYFSQTCTSSTCVPVISLVGSTCNGKDYSTAGAPIPVPIEKTVSTWVSDQCVDLRARSK